MPVCSGVPQGSVLRPILFLIYINELPDSITSKVRLFADITALYLTIEGENDSAALQHDLDKLSVWERDWDMDVEVPGYSGDRVQETYKCKL